MSRRTSEASKAVKLAWQNEQKLVFEGKGTRDWTAEQQKDIMDKGKAYDKDGRAFEGHHMKSAEKYSEFQGKPDNIQFLTRTEHFAAHDGSFQNPTNSYYNPITGETHYFGLSKYEPCKIIVLSNPIAVNIKTVDDKIENGDTDKLKHTETGGNKEIKETSRKSSLSMFKSTNTSKRPIVKQLVSGEKTIPFNRVASGLKKARKFFVDHRKEIGIGIAAFTVVKEVKEIIRNSSSGSENSNSNTDYKPSIDANMNYDYEEIILVPDDYSEPESNPDNIEETSKRSSPRKHEVSGHSQPYHTKNGIELREKSPYSRGEKKNHDTD